MNLSAEKRADIVRAAKEWLRTPYHHQARVKGVGADCAMFPLAVYQECGVLPVDFVVPAYSVQWHLHRSDEIYLQTIAPFTEEMTNLFAGPHGAGLSAGKPLPASFVIFQFGRTFSHGGIVLEWPLIIHSYIPHGVLLSDAERDGELIGREKKFFEVKAWA
jgi:cell wall-associated NlpC family hydrolase